MSKKIDLTGQLFGFLKVVGEAANPPGGEARWVCTCLACGKTDHVVRGTLLRDGRAKSCGCLIGGAEDLTGRRFGRWVVLRRSETPLIREGREPTGRGAWWWCHCDCGTEKPVRAQGLKTGMSTSCGCYQRERAVETQTGHAPYVKDPEKRSAYAKQAHVELRKYGSEAARPRSRWSDTLYSRAWLTEHYLDRRLSKSQMALLAGCSLHSVVKALRRANIQRLEDDPQQSVTGLRRTRRTLDPLTKGSTYRLARDAAPLGPCKVCGVGVGKHVNHKDRDPWNNEPSNLERVCVRCHNRQHAQEIHVMIEWLKERFQVPFLDVHLEARARLLKDLAGPSEDVLQGVAQALRQSGFPVQTSNPEEVQASRRNLSQVSLHLDAEGVLSPYTTLGTKVCATFFPHRYKAAYKGALSAWQAWHDDETLKKAVRLQLDSGDPTTPDRVLKALVFQHRTPSVFRPAVAKYVYENFASGGVVWDPCAGFGGRLLGAVAAGVRTYIGCDVEPETVEGNNALAEALGVSDQHTVVLARAEEFDPGTNLDLVFTSPPYFDLEQYGEASRSLAASYGSSQGWVERFLHPVLLRARSCLRSGGSLILNLPMRPVQGVRLDREAGRLAEALGFEPRSAIQMPVRRRSKILGWRKTEPLLVWVKP